MADYFTSLDFDQPVTLTGTAITFIIVVMTWLFYAYIKKEIRKQKTREARGENAATQAEAPRPLSSKDLFMVVNIQYYDVILSSLTRSLQWSGYTLTSEATAETLLPAHVFEEVAREVDRARQDYMTALHYDTRDDVAAHMLQGYAQVFLSELIRGCAHLGWKVTPYVRMAEDECVNSCSASS